MAPQENEFAAKPDNLSQSKRKEISCKVSSNLHNASHGTHAWACVCLYVYTKKCNKI